MTQCCLCCLLFLLCWKKKAWMQIIFQLRPFFFLFFELAQWKLLKQYGRFGEKGSLMTSALWSVRHISLEKKKEKKGWANYPSSPEERGPPGDLDSSSLVKVESVTPPIKLEFNCWVTFPGVGDSTKGIVGKRCSSNPTCADRVFGVSAGCVLHV